MEDAIAKVYENVFLFYLLTHTPIMELDDMLTEAGVPVADRSKGKNHLRASRDLNFFSVLSVAHTERLDKTEKIPFVMLLQETNEENLKNALDRVEETYRKVMCADPDNPADMTCVGPYSDIKYCVENDAIALGFERGDAGTDSIGESATVPATAVIERVEAYIRTELPEKISRELGARFVLVE